MKVVTPRSFYQQVPEETVMVAIDSDVVGTFVPVGVMAPEAVELARAPLEASRQAGGGVMGSQVARDAVLRKVNRAK